MKAHQHVRYTRKQLTKLTTLQLRDICFKEKLVKGIANYIDREAYDSWGRRCFDNFLTENIKEAVY
jgi:hypothetical protein